MINFYGFERTIRGRCFLKTVKPKNPPAPPLKNVFMVKQKIGGAPPRRGGGGGGGKNPTGKKKPPNIGDQPGANFKRGGLF